MQDNHRVEQQHNPNSAEQAITTQQLRNNQTNKQNSKAANWNEPGRAQSRCTGREPRSARSCRLGTTSGPTFAARTASRPSTVLQKQGRGGSEVTSMREQERMQAVTDLTADVVVAVGEGKPVTRFERAPRRKEARQLHRTHAETMTPNVQHNEKQ